MQKIIIEKDIANIDVYVNGTPSINDMPTDELNTIFAALEFEIYEHYKAERYSDGTRGNI